ncbi:hypothetical protein AVV48_gp80 [Acinetobacter phage phiAC-1]|uniref:hypothetical protein n=1 Tax=Acinetobacter phage phiAC-1 TaxID=1229760 RepID=UPI00028B84CC|nr:hypothetical protein AVV48_gp80 [Acinetobacter phage phiAC-1]AFU62329.1 hypothetical protein phiAC-1_0080 [Acinetobacter phage phiAC-1]
MSKYKVGDEVVLVKAKDWVKDFGGKIGGIYEIVDFWDDDIGIQSLDGSGLKFYVSDYNIKLHEKPKYQTSNRYKLHKYILSTGFTKQDLSLALNKNQSYLTTETRASQFYNRGDMSDARYKSLRKQIKEAVQIKSEPADISVVAGEITQTLAEIKPKEKDMSKDTSFIGCSWSELSNTFDCQPNQKQEEKTIDEKVKEAKEALDTFTAPKPSNNGAFILGLVFFVLLIIFGIGCLIYKAA